MEPSIGIFFFLETLAGRPDRKENIDIQISRTRTPDQAQNMWRVSHIGKTTRRAVCTRSILDQSRSF